MKSSEQISKWWHQQSQNEKAKYARAHIHSHFANRKAHPHIEERRSAQSSARHAFTRHSPTNHSKWHQKAHLYTLTHTYTKCQNYYSVHGSFGIINSICVEVQGFAQRFFIVKIRLTFQNKMGYALILVWISHLERKSTFTRWKPTFDWCFSNTPILHTFYRSFFVNPFIVALSIYRPFVYSFTPGFFIPHYSIWIDRKSNKIK